MKPKSLYNPKDVQEARRELFDKQKGVDPILNEKIAYSDSVQDHDHTSQHCRAALHRQSNAWEGLVFNAYRRCLQWVTDKPLPDLLRNLALYLEQDYSANPYHSDWIKRVTIDYKKLTASQQAEVLNQLGSAGGSNAAERLKLFKARTLDRSLGYDTIRNLIEQTKGIL